jgi:hypothetical protein
MNEYSSYTPFPDKWLQPDGSITTHDGTVVEAPSPEGAEAYKAFSPIPNKTLLPDGTIGTFSSGGGGTFPPIPVPRTLGTYNLKVQVSDEGVVSYIWGKVL